MKVKKFFVSILLAALPASVLAGTQATLPAPVPTKVINPKVAYPPNLDKIMAIQKTRISGATYDAGNSRAMLTLEIVYTPAVTCENHLQAIIEVKDGEGVNVADDASSTLYFDKPVPGQKKKFPRTIFVNSEAEQVAEINFKSLTCSQ